MIEESLLKTGIAGKDGFVWWVGQVAHQKSWKPHSQFADEKGSDGKVWASRCKVRIVGYHTFDGNVLPDDDLPWAQISMDPTFGSGQGGMGATNNLAGGETCFGFFLDGDDAQQPVIIGLLYRSDGVKNLIDEQSIAKEKSSKFKPFTGHPDNIITPTQRYHRPIKEIDTNDTGKNNQTPIPGKQGDGLVVPTKSENTVDSLHQFCKKADITLTLPNGCQNGLIGDITQTLQSFVAITNGLDKYLHFYIDPVLNEIVDIGNQISKTARSVLRIVKLVINNLRSTIFKSIGWAFRQLVGLVVPVNQQKIVLEAMKKIFDTMFCILEKLPGQLLDFVKNLLTNLVDSTINVPACAAEQFTAGILAQLMNLIEGALNPILSGIGWLTGGIGQVSGILNQTSSLASQIYSFLDCTGLACKAPYTWAAKFGPSQKETDNWKSQVQNINVFRQLSKSGSNIENALAQTPLYSTSELLGTKFGAILDNALNNPSCSSKTTNPQTQDDLMPMPIGSKWAYCIPPQVYITGDGIGARANPIVSRNGQIFSVEIASGGVGYVQGRTTVRIVDNSGYGVAATANAIVASDGSISSIYVTNPGSGYCAGNLPQSPGISSQVSGTVDRVIVIAPGYGYTTGDTITDGKNTYTPIVSPGSGMIVDVNQPNNAIGDFTQVPTLTINTNTGIGAKFVPLMKFTPSYVGIGSTTITSGIGVTSVIDCMGT